MNIRLLPLILCLLLLPGYLVGQTRLFSLKRNPPLTYVLVNDGQLTMS